MKTASSAIFFFLLSISIFAQVVETSKDSLQNKKLYFTKAIASKIPVIDGHIDDEVWNTVEWGGDFIQWNPAEGKAPTHETNFKILYDASNLYVAYRCFDSQPEKIEKRLSRRDGFEGDWIEINIDSYHDLRTAFSFTISAAGVKGDEFISDDGNNWDSNWNPIWYAKTQSDDLGWTAEIRIPLSQLRFANKEEHVWGIQMTRREFRFEERSVWQFIPRNSSSWVSSFGELHGIVGIKPQKQLEVQPYVLAQASTYEKEEGNPFLPGQDFGWSAGVDGKVGVTSDLTIDFTINPDFGQVEADPSALALDGFQIFFPERRPFFIEGRNIFDYRMTQSEAGGPFTSDVLFYSRRIGGSPHGYPNLSNNEFTDVPSNSSILGAAKFSGKTQNGTSIGILESVTQREYAQIDSLGERRKEIVEPLTNYFVGRLQQDFHGGNTLIGGMFTAVNRHKDDLATMGFLHTSAYTGGLDILLRNKKQIWFVAANVAASKVNGSTESIIQTQRRQEHLFQRVDAGHLEVDSTATSLTGTGGTLRFGKVGGGKKINFETGVTWRSPEFELNNMGFMRSSDDIVHFFWGNYRLDKPFSIFRNMRFNYNHWRAWDFEGTPTYGGWNVNGHASFKNSSGTGTGFNFNLYDVGTKALRGGPNLRFANSINNWVYYESDQRKKVQYGLNLWHKWGLDNADRANSYNIWLNFQPTKAFQISLGPGYGTDHTVLQYVENVDTKKYGTRYINATIDQKTLDVTVRLNYTINPDLSIQYYGAPFITTGQYSEFKYISGRPMDDEFHNRYIRYDNNQITYSKDTDEYLFDEDRDGETDYKIGSPDFNFMQFRSNLVVRYEYIPGSEVFLVWSQGNTNFGNPTEQLIPSLANNLFSEKGENIFLVKFTYRFIR